MVFKFYAEFILQKVFVPALIITFLELGISILNICFINQLFLISDLVLTFGFAYEVAIIICIMSYNQRTS